MKLDTFCQLIVLFFLFSVVGWIMEVTLKFIQFRRFINRGFLIGPYCPIYGCGVVLVTVLVGGFVGRNGTIGEIFLVGMVICGGIEYFSSWYMEKMFHARWWDYSQKPMNLSGRIWIGNLLLFGLACVIIVKWVDPLFFAWIENWSRGLLRGFAVGVAVIMISDFTASHIFMNLVKKEIDSQTGDNTEAITTQIHELLKDKQLLIRRIHQAYPNMQARPHHLVERYRKAKAEFKEARHNAAVVLKEAAKKKRASIKLDEELELRLREAASRQREAARKLRDIQRRLSVRKKDILSDLYDNSDN